MSTMFLEVGVFNVALIFAMYHKIHSYVNEYRDCLLFSRLLLATIGILTVDTIGWVIDGNPIGGQIWFTVVIDGLDLILTTTVCWCWVKYAVYIADEEGQTNLKWYKDFASLLLMFQIVLVCSSQVFGFYFSVDSSGVYHREAGYLIHSLISLALLAYSSGKCLLAYSKSKENNQELLFVSLIILIPILGNVFQLYIYGYPTVWLCMVFIILIVYIHIQNKRIDEEREEQNAILKKALDQAELANKAKTDFLTRMSHDMRTPMNGILGITSLMADETSVEEMKAELPKIEESGEFLLQLINDVLDVNKVESGKVELNPKVCDEERIFDSIIAMVKPQMDKKSIDFTFKKINIEWTYMRLDVQRVKQIFINLLTNAVKFTPEGGKIDFIMELVSEDDNMIRDKFIIRDNGIGVSEEFLPKIFNPFAQEGRLHENLGGTGLGLSIVKSLVELMGGNIEVKSKINEGTEFTLYLNFPLAPKPSDAIEKHPMEAEYNHFPENLNVLLCEDHPLNAEITIRLLQKKNAMVVWKENGKLGVDQFAKSELGHFDVVLMDIRMPIMDGIEATRQIRALNRTDAKTVPIIAMTANAYDEDKEEAKEAGMNAHLAKPVNPKLMYSTIAKYVEKK